MIKKITFVFVLFLFLIKVSFAQGTTFYVTDQALGNSGSLDVILTQAKASANSGQSVQVLFNAPGFCQLTYQLPLLSITSGSITLDKDPTALVDQGIQYASTAGNNSIGYGFFINGIQAISSITIQNLTIRDFIPNPNSGYTRLALYLENSFNVKIKNCKFIANYGSISYSRTTNFEVRENEFINNLDYGPIQMNEWGPNTNYYSSRIVKNKFTVTLANKQNSPGAMLLYGGSVPVRHFVEVDSNQVYDYRTGIYVVNGAYGTPTINDPSFQVSLLDNVMVNEWNVYFNRPYKHFIMSNNSLTAQWVNIYIPGGSSTPNVYGIDFINANGLGFPTVNNGNIFQGVNSNSQSYSTIQCFYSLGLGVKVVGQDLPGRVLVGQGKHLHVRGNKIVSNGLQDLPIDQILMGNDEIASPTLISATSTSGTLTVKFELNGNEHIQPNRPFFVDFYKSNISGDLVNYIGDYTVSSLTGNVYTANINLPSGITISVGDRIAATVTGMGNIITPQDPKGTSEASYITLTVPTFDPPPPCLDCISSFAPEPGKKYVLSGWVKEANAPASKTSYDFPQLIIQYPSLGVTLPPFTAKGAIIDGWQRIEGEFIVPLSVMNMTIKLNCLSGEAFFDDIRVFPVDGSLKSYVFDPVTLKLSAELDENNYATFYEYDEEGKLVRVKKETERGVMTIQENKNSMKKAP